jgi:hypothetical protein
MYFHSLRASPVDNGAPMTDPNPARRSATSRVGKTLVGAYLDTTDLFTIRELCLRLGRARGVRMTMQEFAVNAFTRECEYHGVKLSGKS